MVFLVSSFVVAGSLRSKRFRGVWEQRKTEERNFRYFACAPLLLTHAFEFFAPKPRRNTCYAGYVTGSLDVINNPHPAPITG